MTLGQAGKGPHVGQGKDGQVLDQSTCQGSRTGKDGEQNIPGAAGAAGGGSCSSPGEALSDVPTGKSGQSPVSQKPPGLGQMAF